MSNPYVLNNDLIYGIDKFVTEAGSLGIGYIKDEGKARFVITGAGPSNTVRIRAKIVGQETWVTIIDLVGNVNELIDIYTYDQLEVLCTVFEAANGYDFKIVATSFDGSKLFINTPDGTLENISTVNFVSTDNSISITSDSLTGSIDFKTIGGGGGVEKYASLSAFPAIGNLTKLYLAEDTKLLYEWTGSAYVEVSTAPVKSVNTKTGDVVLNKTDIGLGNVDNTSDLSKPISTATQNALDDLDGYAQNIRADLDQEVLDREAADNTKVSKAGDTMSGQLKMLDTNILVDSSISAGIPVTTQIDAGFIAASVTEGVVTSNAEVATYGVSVSRSDANSTTSNKNVSLSTADGSPLISATSTDFVNNLQTNINFDDTAMHYEKADNNAGTIAYGTFGAGVFDIQTTQADNTYTDITGDSTGISMTSYDGNVTTSPLMPTLPEHVTVKKYVDDQDALKENVANKTTDGTLSANSDTLYPSEKAVKTYVDATSGVATANFDASTYYHELHVNYDFTGATSDGSPYKPFKTIQAAVNAAQLQNVGGNTAILIHLKKDIAMVENIVVNNAVSNLYIMPAVSNNTASAPFKIIGSLTISGSQTNRVRVKDIEFAPTSGYALIINDTPGRHSFQNCGFVNGSIAGQSGTGVNLTSTYQNFIEFFDCTIEGTINIDGTPPAGTTVTMYRSRLTYANVIVNSVNVAVGMYDTYGIYGITHTAGALAITGMWGFTQAGFFNSTAALSGINFLSIANASLQKPDLSFIALNKTGTCPYQLINLHRGETSDVLSGSRIVYGPTATDAGYKMGVSGNWSPAVSNVAGALDQLAANKISTSQKGVANGVASLDGTGKVPSTQLPAYVDDVLEYANLASFPATGSTGIIYVALDTNKIYRWSGSTYIEISPSVGAVWGGITGTLSSQTDLQNALNAKFNNPTGTAADYIAGDGSILPFPSVSASDRLVTTVYNQTGSSVPAGSVIYINGPHGNLPSLILAQADSEAHSFLTYGITQSTIGNQSSGIAIQEGRLENLNTNITGWDEGDILFLSPSVAGGITNVKPSAPNHMVIVGTLVRKHPTQGVIQVKIQNGYELNELHNVSIPSTPSNNEVLKYDSSTSLWKNQYIGLSSDIEHTSFSLANNQSSVADVTGLAFSASAVRGFSALVTVTIDATADLYETFELIGINKAGSFDMIISSSGDDSGIVFSVTSAGQVQYTSSNYSGFVSGTIKFRAITTSI